MTRRALLSAPRFRLFWASIAVSSSGDQFFTVALPWLVLELAGSDVALGSILMTAALPRAAFMLAGGALSDRVAPARVLLFANMLRALMVGAVAALAIAGRVQLWHLYPLAVAFGVLGALSGPASAALLPRVTPHGQLTAANGLVQGTAQVGAMVTPAPAGALIAAAGVGSALSVSAAASALAGTALAFIPRVGSDPPDGEDDALRSGAARALPGSALQVVRDLLRDPPLRAYLVLLAALSLAMSGPLAVGIPSLARTRFAGSVSFGFMLSASGAGTLVGALIAGSRRRVRHRGRVLLAVNVLIGVLMVLLGYAPTAAVASLIIATMACASTFMNVIATASLQAQADRAILGRVMSVVMLASIGLAPLSYLLAGFLSAVDPVLLFGAAGAVVIAATAHAASSRALRQLD